MTVSSQDVKKKSFIHKIFTTKEKEGSSSLDCSALEVFAQIAAQKHHILWNKWSQRSRLHYAVAAQDPVGLDLPLEDDVVLIVGHFHDSSEQRIRFPSSDDCVFAKENSGRVEDPGERFARLDCGVAVINIMESMASGIPVLEHFEDDDMKEMRATIVSSLLNDEFNWSQQ